MMNWDQAPSASYGSTPLAILRCAGFIILIVSMVPVHLIYSTLFPREHYRLPLLFHRVLLKLIGFRVQVRGTMATRQPVFFVANHVSYLDIPVLGALIPGSFVAKVEVASWPLFGLLAKLQGTVFIERRSTRASEQRDELTNHLANGRNLIVFPEGTSSDGQMVLPFKSSLFGAIENAADTVDITVQPVSVACTALDGLPLTQFLRPFYAWYGDMTLLPHLWQAFKCDRFTIDVVFHPPFRARDVPDRKQLAAACQKAVASGVEHCITGRWPQEEPALIAAPVSF
jgi:1-acyl-sn-glycerol-3-phosphate acyltransferase